MIKTTSDHHDEATRDGRRPPRRLRTALGAGFAIAILLVGLAHAPFARHAVQRALIARAGSADAILAIGQLDYNLLTLRVTATGVSLATRGKPGSGEFFRAERVAVRLRPSALLGHLRFAEVELVRPMFTARRGADGGFNLPANGASSGTPPSIEIGRLVIDRLDCALLDARSLSIVVQHASIDTRPDGARISGRLVSAPSGSLRLPAGGELNLGVDALVSYQPGRLAVRPLTVRLDGSTIDADGWIAFDQSPARIDLALRGSVGLEAAARLWPALAPARGQVRATGRVTGPLSQLALALDTTAAAVVVRGVPLDGASSHVSLDGSTLALDPVTIELAHGRVVGSLATSDAEAGSSPIRQVRVRAQWDRLELSALLAAFGVGAPPNFPAASVSGGGSAEWDARGVESLSLDVAARTATPLPHGGPARGDYALHAAGARWTLDAVQPAGRGTRVAGRLEGRSSAGDFGATTVGGRLEVNAILDELAPWANFSRDLQPILQRSHGKAAGRVDVSGTLRAPRFAVSVAMRDLRVDGVGTGAIETVAHLDLAGATVDRAQLTLGRNSVEASGTVPFRRGPLDVRFLGALGDLGALLPPSTTRWLPAGRVAVSGSIAGALDAIQVDTKVTSAELSWQGFRPGPVEGEVRVAGGRVSGRVTVPSLRASVRGTYGLSAPNTYEVSAFFDASDLAVLADLAHRVGGPALVLGGTTSADILVTGTMDGATPTVGARVQSAEGQFQDLPFHLQAPARLQFSPSAIEIDPLRLRLGTATIDADGGIASPGHAAGPQGTRTLRVTIDAPVEDWQPLVRRASGVADLRAAGRLHAELTASGSWRDTTLAGTISLANASAASASLGEVSGLAARLVLQDDRLDLVEARGAWSGAPVEVSGSIPMRLLAPWLPGGMVRPSTQPLHLRAAITSADRKVLAPWLSSELGARLDGTVSATVEIDAPEPSLASARGTGSIAIAGLVVSGSPLTMPSPARLRLESGQLLLEPASLQMRGQTLTAGGSVNLNPSSPLLDLSLKGGIDLGVVRAFVPLAANGNAAVDVRLAGDASHPKLTGAVRIVDAGIGISNPRIAISSLNGAVTLDGDRVNVKATGNANGGGVSLQGTVFIGAGAPRSATLRLQGKDNAIEFPEGLRSSLDLDVTYRLDASGGLLAGRIIAEPGAYRRAAIPQFGSRGGEAASSGPSALGATKLDLAVSTRSPGLVDNSFAEVEVDADLRLTGTVDQPTLGGRLTGREGGKVSLRGNNFVIDRGFLAFDPKPGARPALEMTARSRRSGYNIALGLTGPLDNLRVDLRSDPPLAQPDLMSLIATGSVSNSMSSSSTTTGTSASQDALVAGISSDILGLAGNSIGLDSVTVGQLDLDLLGQDVDPETRLTIGKSIGSRVNLLLSQNLRDSGLTWVITVRPAGKFDVSYVSRDAVSSSVELRHEVVFGGAPQPAPAPPAPARKKLSPTIAAITVSGPGASQALLDHTSLHAGDRFDFFEWQRDREAIEQSLREAGYLEAQVAARRAVKDEAPGLVGLDYQVTRGPKTVLVARGFALPEDVLAGMRAAWSLSVDDTRLLADLTERARAAMADERYPAASVQAQRLEDGRPGEKTISVDIVPGRQVQHRQLAFEGNRAITAAVLQDEVTRLALDRTAWRDPSVLGPALTDFYRREGFFAARVAPGRVVVEGDTARLPVKIVEGPLHRVTSVTIAPAPVDRQRLADWAGIRPGDTFDPKALEAARQRIQKGLERDGYRDAQARLTPRVDASTGRVELLVEITAGARSVIAGVSVVGRDTTRESIVVRAMRLRAGTPASPDAVDVAQRRLYQTDAFRSVRIDLRPAIEAPPPAPSASEDQGSRSAAIDQPMHATVTLEEAPLYRLRYGVQFGRELDDVTQQWTSNPGLAVEARRRNVFGTAFGAAVGLRVDAYKQSLRSAINIPASVFWPAISTLFVTRTRTAIESAAREIQTETQITYQDRWRVGRHIEWTYGYSVTGSERKQEVSTFSEPSTVDGYRADVYTAIARDSRDSPFNATRGTFHSASIEHGGSKLGSDIGYMRYLFQASYYAKTGPLVLAGAMRFGAVTRLTGDNQQSYDIRFRTGGDREVRGYEQESLHPPEIEGQPVGGQALLVLNGEVRFPIAGWLKAATFVDAGNAFTDLGAISFGGLKVGMGVGVRLDTPYALFRVDFGLPVPREPGGPLGRWYFSVGQSF